MPVARHCLSVGQAGTGSSKKNRGIRRKMINVLITRAYFSIDDIADGDIEYRDIVTEVVPADDAESAAEIICDLGLSFAATGADWAVSPDGAQIANFRSGIFEEVTARIVADSDSVLAAVRNLAG